VSKRFTELCVVAVDVAKAISTLRASELPSPVLFRIAGCPAYVIAIFYLNLTKEKIKEYFYAVEPWI
jgi:hypothetical protein